MKVLMLTTGFPRFVGDLFGAFVSEQAHALNRRGVQVSVLAPHERGLARRETVGTMEVFRFRYAWPAVIQQVAYGGGIPTNVRSSWWVRFQVPFSCLGSWWVRVAAANPPIWCTATGPFRGSLRCGLWGGVRGWCLACGAATYICYPVSGGVA